MDPLTGVILAVLILLVTVGVWGHAVIRGRMERKTLEAGGGGADLAALRDDYAQLEGRLQQVEEELDFLRRLREPGKAAELPGPEGR